MNPLSSREFLIPFGAIRPEHVEPGVKAALSDAEAALERLRRDPEPPTYANTLGALEALTEPLGRVVTIAAHLQSVRNSPEMRAAYNAVVPLYRAFYARLPLDAGLWARLKAFAETPEAQALTGVHRRHLEKTLEEFRREGADLPPEQKARVEEIQVALGQLATRFSENVLDSTNAFELVLDEAEVAGLPASALSAARESAAAKGLPGYRFTLQAPSYLPFMQYADRRDLRQRMYEAYMSRSSTPPHDNRPLLADILALRRELAAIHGYATFADYRLAEHMVPSGDAVQDFQDDLYRQTLPYWQREIETLTRFARESLGLAKLEPWDTAYATEKLRRARFDFDEEELRPYFPLEQVLAGMFGVAQRLFGVRVSPREDAEAWHPDVRAYDIHETAGHGEAGTHLGSFYADWFPREDKRAGAWMNRFITGGPAEDGGFAPHLALMCANFTRPQGDKPALLTHREVQTTFHEFGHLLHHCLSRVPVRERAGANVAWDFVELPSQIMENWTYEREALDLFARHYETGAPIPAPLFEKMQRARTFMAANQQMRQLSFGAVDLALHTAYGPEEGDVIPYGNRVMERFVMRPEFAHNAFLAAFSHIFAGGYAAAYYSYKWSEMLEADAFTRFQREGIFNPETGRDFRDTILARGDSADPSELYRAFMGRDPDAGALIARNLGPLPVGAS